MGSKLRVTQQVRWDGDVNLENVKLTNLANGVNPQDAVTKAQLDSATVGLLDDRGNFDASVNTFPASGGSGTAGAILKGDIWVISVGGTLGGSAVSAGDSVRALVDTPGQTASNWGLILSGSSLGYTAENTANKVTAWSGTPNNTNYPSEKLVKDSLDLKANTSDLTNKLTATNYVCREVPSGTKNGSNTAFTLANTPTAGTEMLFVNGILQNAGAGNDYTISGANITFLTAPISTDTILITYWK